MFKKLHLKLTAFNLIILMVFFIIFSSFIYFQTGHMLRRSSEIAIHGLSRQIKTLHRIPEKRTFHPDEADDLNIHPELFIILLRDASLNITSSNTQDSHFMLDSSKEINKLFESKKDNLFSKITIKGEPYRVYTAYFHAQNGEWGVIQICQNIRMEKNILNNLLKTLLLLGLTSIAFLAGISWLLASKSLEPIKTSWEQQKRFIADASHELRTPLTVMKANLEIPLQEQNGTIADHYTWIKNAYEETNNMSYIVSSLLELSQIDSGQIKIFKNTIDLGILLKQTINSIRPLYEEKKIQLSTKICEEEIFIMGDEQKIKQLIMILLDNALKYTESGSVHVTLSKEKADVLLTIKDSGIGISDEDKIHIFERFYRADKTRSRAQGSLGLGLSIAKWIVEEHNGQIKVESEYQKGSTFTIILRSA